LQAQANYAAAQANKAATEKQLPVLKAQREIAQAQLEQARAALEQAGANLSRTSITAPVAGRVTRLTTILPRLQPFFSGDYTTTRCEVRCCCAVAVRSDHDPENWKPVFRKDHAPMISRIIIAGALLGALAAARDVAPQRSVRCCDAAEAQCR
jgi:hypothetical protein